MQKLIVCFSVGRFRGPDGMCGGPVDILMLVDCGVVWSFVVKEREEDVLGLLGVRGDESAVEVVAVWTCPGWVGCVGVPGFGTAGRLPAGGECLDSILCGADGGVEPALMARCC